MRAMLLLVLLAGPVLGDAKTAAVHNRQAKAYFDAKQYDAAIAEFKKSYEQDKKPLTLFKIASAYYANADYKNAIDYYGKYLQAEPDGKYAAEALQFTTVAKRALDDAEAKRLADERAAKKAADDKAAAEEAERARVAAAGHVENAKAFARANAWTSAGDEYRAATVADGDVAHLLDAAEAYAKQPDHAKASEAYRAYLEKVPLGGKSDEARAKLAEQMRALADEAERKRVADAQAAAAAAKRDEPEPKGPPPITRGWSSYGPRAAIGVSQGDVNPLMMDSGRGLVFKPAFEVGGFARYQLGTRIAVRPEATLLYRSASFDGGMMMTQNDAVILKRGGVAVSVPVYLSLQERDGLRLGFGPMVAVMPVLSDKTKTGFASPGDAELLDYGLITGLEYDLGLVSIELRFTKTFGQLASNFDSTMYALQAGIAFGFEPARAARAP